MPALPDEPKHGALPVAAITFLEAELTDNMAAAGEEEPWGGLAGLAEAGVAKDSDGHAAEGQEGLVGSGWLTQTLSLLVTLWRGLQACLCRVPSGLRRRRALR